MKKLFALMVALLMVVLPVATAEAVFTLSNPVLTVNDNTYDLNGWKVEIAAGEIGDIDAYHIVVSNGSASIAMDANVVGNMAYAQINGKVYSLSIPSNVSANDMLSASQKASLGIDIEALISQLLTYATVDGNTIRVPYTAVNQFLAGLVPALKNVPNADVSKLANLVDKAMNSNSGVNLEGTYVDSDSGADLSVKGYVVRDGVAHDNAAFTLDMSASDSAVSVTADAGARGFGRFSITDSQISAAASGSSKSVSVTVSYEVHDADVSLVAIDTTNAVDARTISKSKLFNILSNALKAAA